MGRRDPPAQRHRVGAPALAGRTSGEDGRPARPAVGVEQGSCSSDRRAAAPARTTTPRAVAPIRARGRSAARATRLLCRTTHPSRRGGLRPRRPARAGPAPLRAVPGEARRGAAQSWPWPRAPSRPRAACRARFDAGARPRARRQPAGASLLPCRARHAAPLPRAAMPPGVTVAAAARARAPPRRRSPSSKPRRRRTVHPPAAPRVEVPNRCAQRPARADTCASTSPSDRSTLTPAS